MHVPRGFQRTTAGDLLKKQFRRKSRTRRKMTQMKLKGAHNSASASVNVQLSVSQFKVHSPPHPGTAGC